MARYLIYLSVAILVSACGKSTEDSHETFPNPAGKATSTALDNSYKIAALAVLQIRCASCHSGGASRGNISSIDNVDHLISAALIIPGSPERSPLFAEIRGGDMPPNVGLAAEEIELIRNWIAAAKTPITTTTTLATIPDQTTTTTVTTTVTLPTITDNSPTTSTSTTTTLPQITDQLIPSFKSIAANIFQAKCVSCHSTTGKQKGGQAFDSYEGVLKGLNLATPEKSLIYTEVSTGSMPPKSRDPLTSEQERVLLQWIQNGAPNN